MACTSRNAYEVKEKDYFSYFFRTIPTIQDMEESEIHIIFTVNTSFCGSCTKETKSFLLEKMISPYSKTYITDGQEASFQDSLLLMPNTRVQTMPISEQEKAGIFSTYNKIYIIRGNSLIYENYVIQERLSSIRKAIRKASKLKKTHFK